MPIEVFQAAEKTLFQITQGTLGLEAIKVAMLFECNPGCVKHKHEILGFEELNAARGFNHDPARDLLQKFKDDSQGREHLALAYKIGAVVDGKNHLYETNPSIEDLYEEEEKPAKKAKADHKHETKAEAKSKAKAETKEKAPEPSEEPKEEEDGE